MDDERDKRNGDESPPDAVADDAALTRVKEQLKGMSVPDEILEVLQGSTSGIDVNVLLVTIVQKAPPDQFAEEARQILALTQEYEKFRLDNFKARADAVIDVKTRDPDDIEKRANNQARRALKYAIAVIGLAGSAGAVAGVALESGIVIVGLMLSIAIISLATLPLLASGESISANDVVRIVRAVGRIAPPWAMARTEEPKEDAKTEGDDSK